jgi:hypothetical protein
VDHAGVKKINVKAIIIRANGSQEDQGIISSWESCSDERAESVEKTN